MERRWKGCIDIDIDSKIYTVSFRCTASQIVLISVCCEGKLITEDELDRDDRLNEIYWNISQSLYDENGEPLAREA